MNIETYGLTEDQVQRIIEHVVHARDGLTYKEEMADKIEMAVGGRPFETIPDDAAEAQALGVLTNASTMAGRP